MIYLDYTYIKYINYSMNLKVKIYLYKKLKEYLLSALIFIGDEKLNYKLISNRFKLDSGILVLVSSLQCNEFIKI